MLCELAVCDPEEVKVHFGRVCPSVDHRENKIAVCHIETGGENVRCSGLDVFGIARFHALDAITEAFGMLRVVISQKFADPIVMLLNSYDFPVGLYQLSVGFRLVAVLDGCRTIHLRMAGKVAVWRLRLLPAPMLDDVVTFETEQVHREQ